ncbi:MAG: hypothetical protein PHD95_00920 [Candidatus ainarchaeum sp.]|nr:hypothetical protein [Candidatus ainarchaeum sp.]
MRRNALKSIKPTTSQVRRLRTSQVEKAQRASAGIGPGLAQRERDFIIKVRATAASLQGWFPKKVASGTLARLIAQTMYEKPSEPAVFAIKRIIETPKKEDIVPPQERQKMPPRPGLKRKKK